MIKEWAKGNANLRAIDQLNAVEIARFVIAAPAPASVRRRARGPYRVQMREGRRWRDVRVLAKRREALALAEKMAGEMLGEVRVWADYPRKRCRTPKESVR